MEIINLTDTPSRNSPLVRGRTGRAAELFLRLDADGSATIEVHEVPRERWHAESGWMDDGWEWRSRMDIGESYVIDNTAIDALILYLEPLLTTIHEGALYDDPNDPTSATLSPEATEAVELVAKELCATAWTGKQVLIFDPGDWLIADGNNSAQSIIGDIPDKNVLDLNQEDSIVSALVLENQAIAEGDGVVFEGSLEDALRYLVQQRREELQWEIDQLEDS
jgi:hypothetical protein